MASKEADNRKKSVLETRDTKNLITEETDGKNIFEKQVFDVIEYLEKEAILQNNSVARKILKLKEYGITDEQIIDEYSKFGGSLENQNTVNSNLESVFVGLVEHINSLPNGIVIDFSTGLKDEEKSFEQAIQYGIYSEDSIVENLNQTIQEDLKNYFGDSSEKVEYLLENFRDTYMLDDEGMAEFGRDFKKFLDKDENAMNLSDKLKKVVKDHKETIGNSDYKLDPHLFEISKLQLLLKETSKGSQEYNLILSQIAEFYEKHTDYVAKELPVLNKDGSLNNDEIIKMQEFSETNQRLVILQYIDKFNGMEPWQIASLDSKYKKPMMMCAFSGLKYEGNLEYQEIAMESTKMIKKLYPALELNNDQELAKFFNKVTGIDANFSSLSKQDLIEIFSRQLKETTENYLETNKGNKIDIDIDIENLNWDASERIVFESAMENYFVGSNINFTEKDEEEYNKMYQDVTIESWIENRENAIKLRYDALITIRDEYKNNPVGTYTEKKLVEIERDIEEFERKFGKFDLTPKEGEVPFEVYREDFVKAGITKYLTRDAREWSQGADYAKLSSEHKKGYIRNILVALEDKDPNSYMTKIALRRLELMGDKFVKINSDGTYEVNEELILTEYKKYSDYEYPSYEQLAESAKLRKNEYLLKKLEEYTNLPESAFVKLVDRDDREAAIAQIDEARYLSNQKRIYKMARKSDDKGDKRRSTEERKKDGNGDVIPDEFMRDAILEGTLHVEEINVDKGNRSEKAQTTREDGEVSQENQDESTGDSNASGSEKKSPIELEEMDTSVTEVVQPNFMDKLKNAFKGIKEKIQKIIKGEEEPLQIEAPKDDLEITGRDVGNGNYGYDINKQYTINHDLANSGKNPSENIKSGQETDVGERDN